MILGSAIPSKPEKFIQNCTNDALIGRYAQPASRYLDYLAEETESRYPSLYRYVKVLDRRTGNARYSADADHIIPKSVWNILMPGNLRGAPDEKFPAYSGVLTNLFWRDKGFNRKDDNLAIKLIKEANQAGSSLDRDKWISIFLRTKRDEGVLCTADVTDPRKLDELIGPSSKTNWMAYAARGR
jgi:hypothetical protein